MKNDLRQSKSWKQYLEWLGWKCIRISNQAFIAIRKTPLGAVTKIQRPINLDEKALKELEQLCLDNRAMFIKIEPGLKQDLKLLKAHGYRENRHPFVAPSTIIIDLALSEKELWERLSKSGRYSIRRARREGAKVEFYKNPKKEKIEEFQKIMSETAKYKKLFSIKLKELQKQVELFGDKANLVLVKNGENEYMGGYMCFGVGNITWYLHGATTHMGRKGRWGYELMWQSILYFKREGYTILDLEGTNDERFPSFTKTWGGFSYFKEKFASEKLIFPAPHMKVLSPVLKVFEKIYGGLPL